METKTYKIAGSKFILGMLLVIDGLFIFGSIILSKADDYTKQELKDVMYFCAVIFIIGTFLAINNVVKKITVTPNSIIYKSLFKNKEIALHHIEKFSVKTYTIKIFMKDGTSCSILKNLKFANWLDANFADFDTILYEQEVETMLQDNRYGATVEEREKNLGKSDYYSNTITTIAMVYFGLIVLFPIPLKITMYVGFFLTSAIIIGLVYYKGKLRLEGNTVYPSMYAPSFITILINLTILIYVGDLGTTYYIKPSIIIALVLTAYYIMAIVGVRKFKFKTIGLLLILFLGLMGTGSFVVNSALDTSKPVLFTTQIQDKEVSLGRYTTYKMTLTPWENVEQNSGLLIDVSRRIYKDIKVGETVQIKQHEGFLHNKWYLVYKDGKELNSNGTIFGF